MEFLSGHRPDDLEFLDSNGIDRDEVSAALAHIFNEMIFGDNAPLHCDPHGGNIAIRKKPNRSRHNFDIILYDHGLYRDIARETRRNYAKLWLSVIEADEARMREYSRKVAGVTDEQFPLFASAITGRDYTVLTRKDIASARTAAEKESISGALGEGMLQQLVELLGQVPRIMLLILKTNDLSKLSRCLLIPATHSSNGILYSPQLGREPTHSTGPRPHLPHPRPLCNPHSLRGRDRNHSRKRRTAASV
jgi:aarF domain-containing kinase